MKRIVIMIIGFFLLTGSLYADTIWKSIGADINCREFNCVAVDKNNPSIIYVGTSNGAYKTEDSGLTWERTFTGWMGKKNVRNIYIKGQEIYLCTDRGFFTSKDSGKSWHPSSGTPSKLQIFSLAVADKDHPTVYIATGQGVYRSQNNKSKWRKIFTGVGDMDDAGNRDKDESAQLPKVRSIEVSSVHPEHIYLGTEDGIYISKNKGESFRRLTDEGLTDNGILSLSESPLESMLLHAITKDGIFYLEDRWQSLEIATSLRGARSLSFDLDPKNSTWVATKMGVYKSMEPATEEEIAEIETISLLDNFRGEPTINNVQEKAISYAEVHPDKIANWRRRANMKALLPRLSFGIDQSDADTYEIYTSSSKQYIVEGPVKSSEGWDVTLTWELGDLLWSGDDTTIDVRSKLMVQLRDDVLDEVTSYYFERRKLQVELLQSPPKGRGERVRKELRIQELTANLDALTGSYFSREIEK